MRIPATAYANNDVEPLVAAARAALKGLECASFSAGCRYPGTESEENVQRFKKGFQAALFDALAKALQLPLQSHDADVNFLFDFERGRLDVYVFPVFVGGRYNKFSRALPQTIYYCYKCKGVGCANCDRSGRLANESVQELVAKVLQPAFKARDNKFHGAGREDVDVRMLGDGRPFVVELLEPKKRAADLAALEKEINSRYGKKLEVQGLRFASKEEVAQTKNTERRKRYRALVRTEKAIPTGTLQKLLGSFALKQQTPTRTLERRPDLTRSRSVEIVSVKPRNPKEFDVEMVTSHGTYVKEFVSGDSGRTRPSLAGLLETTAECVELDVLEILDRGPGAGKGFSAGKWPASL